MTIILPPQTNARNGMTVLLCGPVEQYRRTYPPVTTGPRLYASPLETPKNPQCRAFKPPIEFAIPSLSPVPFGRIFSPPASSTPAPSSAVDLLLSPP
jgi:hypothetical protein